MGPASSALRSRGRNSQDDEPDEPDEDEEEDEVAGENVADEAWPALISSPLPLRG